MHQLDRYTPYALAALRVAAGLIFIPHGLQKLFSFPAPFQYGQQSLVSLLGAGAAIEIVTGLLIVVGLFTRPAALLASGTMAVAYWMFHAPANFYPVLNGGDAAILYCFVFLLLVFAGPGAFALDAQIGQKSPAGRPVTA
ncbi:MAG: DoxX family protein [Methylobacteriaceae bacterium]|nr:DoxX family protein [Methylobacteriaceae bacterium]